MLYEARDDNEFRLLVLVARFSTTIGLMVKFYG